MSVRPSVRASALALAALLSVPVSMAATASGAVAAPAPCKVVEQGKGGSKSDLQAAIDAAGTGATLIVTGRCTGSYTVDRNLTIKKGAAAAIINGASGRTLHVTGGTVTVIGVRLTGGTVADCPAYDGYLCGAVILNDARVILDRVTVSGSTVDGGTSMSVYGGTLYNSDGATMTVKRSTIADNLAFAGDGQDAYAPIVNEGTMTIRRSRITGNRSTGTNASGGAIFTYLSTSHLTITDSTFSGNLATATSYAEGGAVEVLQGSVTIGRSLFTDNHAEGPTPTGGSSTSEGGALVVHSDTAISDSTFTRNSAGYGGALSLESGANTITGSTIARNSAGWVGGVGQSGSGTLTIGSTIIALNADSPTSDPDCSVVHATSTGHNLIGKGEGCSGLENGVLHDKVGSAAAPINPKLGKLAANGGPTKTLALLTGSPAIDKAGPAPCDTAKDQRGVKRPKGGACDIGAFEKG